MEGMTDAYLSWFSSLGDAGLANDNPTPSSCELQEHYSVEVLDAYGKLDSVVSGCIAADHNLFYFKPLIKERLLCAKATSVFLLPSYVRGSFLVLHICQPSLLPFVSSSFTVFPASGVPISQSIHSSRLSVTSTESLSAPTSASSSPSALTSTSPSVSVWINGSKLLSSATTQDGGFVMPVLLAHTNSLERLSLSSASLSLWMATTPSNAFNVEKLHL
jgi:hypothetical protein